MNKIYKIIWNQVRGQRIVTDEAHRNRGKGSRVSAFVLCALFGTLLAAASPGLEAAVTVTNGWTHTKISTSGNVANITTEQIVADGKIGVNRFAEFAVAQNHIVNLKLPGSAGNLLNFVETGIEVNGTVNSVIGNAVGGNLFFVTPQGMTVGKTGVINAGSLTAVVTTQDAFKEWTTESMGTLPNVTTKLLDKMQTGEVPINPAGVITVEGSINAGNRIVLAASKIDVRKDARISNVHAAGDDFSKLVNITDESGTIVTASGVDGGLVLEEASDGSGDILLLARSDGSGQTINPTVNAEISVAGSITSREDADVRALAGAGTYDLDKELEAGEGNFKENGSHNIASVTAKVTVTGTVEAAGNVNVAAEAQNYFGESGVIELAKDGAFEILGSVTPFNFDFGFGNLTTRAEVAIEKDARLQAQGSLTTTATADTYLKVGTSTSTFKVFDLLSSLNGKIPAAGVVVGLADSSAKVTVSGTLAAGKSLEVHSSDKLRVDLASSASTALDKSSHVALVVGLVKGDSEVEIASSANVAITAPADEAASEGASTTAESGDAQPQPRTMRIKAEHTSDIRTSAEATTEREAMGALAFNYTEHDSDAKVSVNAALKGADELEVGAKNETLTERMTATTYEIRQSKKLQLFESLAAASSNFVSALMGKAGGGIDKSFTAPNFQLGGAVGVITGTQSASLAVAPAAELSAAEKLTLSSSSVKDDHHYVVTASTNGASAGDQQQGQTKGTGSLALLVAVVGDDKDTSVDSTLTIGDGAKLSVENGPVVIDNRAQILYTRVDVLVDELIKKIDSLKAYSKKDNAFALQWDKVDAATAELKRVWNAYEGVEALTKAMANVGTVLGEALGELGELGGLAGDLKSFLDASLDFIKASNYATSYVNATGTGSSGAWTAALSVGVNMQKTSSLLTIGKGASITAGGTGDAGAVSITGASRNDTVLLGGNLSSLDSILSIPTPVTSDANPVGAALLWHAVDSDNAVILREGVDIKAGALASVTAADESNVLTIGASADVSKGSASIEANAAITDLALSNSLQVDDEVAIRAAGVALNAAREDSVQTITGDAAVGTGETASNNVGAGIALNLGTIDNDLSIADNDVLAEGDASLYALSGSLTAIGLIAPEETPLGSGESGEGGSAEGGTSGSDAGATGRTAGTTEDETTHPITGTTIESVLSAILSSKPTIDTNKEFKPISGTVSITANADLNMNAIGVAGAVSSTSQGGDEPYNPAEHNKVFNKLHGWYTAAKDGLKWAGDGIDAKFNSLLTDIESYGTSLGGDLRSAAQSVFKQNSTQNDAIDANGGNGADPQNNPADAVGEGGANLANPQAPDPLAGQQAQRFQLGLAASVGVNAVDSDNALSVTASNFTIDTVDLAAQAVTDKWVGVWAGAAGLSFVSGTSVEQTAAAGGAIAVNTGTSGVSLSIGAPSSSSASGQSALVLTDRVRRADVYAVSDGTTIAEGLSAAVAKGSGQGSSSQYSFDASVSANLVKNTVTNTVSDVLQEADAGASGSFEWDQAAWSGETQVTGGTGFGLSTAPTGSGRSASFGALVAVADIDNTITASLSKANFAAAQTIDVRALSSLTQVTTAVGANVALGDSSLAFTGAAASAALTNTVSASLESVNAALSDTGLLQVVARDASGSEREYFDSVSDRNWYPDASGELDNSAFYKDVYLQTEQNQDKNDAAHVADFLSGKGMVQTTVAVSLGVSTEDNAGGAGIVVNDIDNTFKTDAKGVTLHTADGTQSGDKGSHYTQRAESGVVSVAVATGVAASGGGDHTHFAAAGSVIVSNVDQTAESTAEKLDVSADNTAIEAGNAATTVNVAGNVGVSLGDSGSAAGAAVVVMNTNNDAKAEVKESGFTSVALDVHGMNKASAWSAAADATVAGSFALGGSVSVNRVMNTAHSTAQKLELDALTKADFTAEDESELWSLAGAVAYGGQTAGVSGAVAYSISGREASPGTQVDVSDLTVDGASGTDVSVQAKAADKVKTLVIAAGVSRGAVGFTGGAGVNEIKRTVSAELKNVTAASGALKALSVQAQEKAAIGNLGIAGAYGANAGVGLGIAVNRISTNTTATLSDDRAQPVEFFAQTLEVKAKTANDIETIAVGGAASQNTAVTGSVGVNLIDDNTTAKVDKVHAAVSGALFVDAQSDDVIGAYVGQAAGASTAAAGLSVLVNESSGKTEAAVSGSTLTETGESENKLTTAGAVADSAVNDEVANDVSISGTLEDDRGQRTVSGMLVSATGTTTFKSLVLNGAGAGTGAGTGTVSVTYLGGTTKTEVTGSTLNAKDALDIFAAHYANVDNISTTAAGAGTGAGAIAVNVATTERAVSAALDGGSLASEGDVSIKAEGKEGVSSLALIGAGAGTGAGVVLANVTRELSDVSVDVARTNATTINAQSLAIAGDYLGRYNALGVSGAGSGAAAGAVNVNVNYGDNDVGVSVGKLSAAVSEKAEIEARRRTENSGIAVNASGSQYAAVSATVLVNTVEGAARTEINGADIGSKEGREAAVSVRSLGSDTMKLVDVTAAGAIVGGGAAVMVNRLYGSALTTVADSHLAGGSVTVAAEQNRFVDATNVFASAGLGALGANVVSTLIGADGDPFASEQTSLGGTQKQIDEYLSTYAGSGSTSDPGIFASALGQTNGVLTDDEKKTMMQAAAQSATADAPAGATHVSVTGSTIEAGTVSVEAREDADDSAGVDVTVGSGEAGGAVLAASVATLRQNRNVALDISKSTIVAREGGRIGARIAGKTSVETYQAAVALASGMAAYTDVEATGGAAVRVADSTLTSQTAGKTLAVAARDDSEIEAFTFGLNVAIVGGGGTIADLRDATSLRVDIDNATLAGNTAVETLRGIKRTVHARSGVGGAVNGQASRGSIKDSGGAEVSVSGSSVTGESFVIEANNRPQLLAKAYQGYASAINVGVLTAEVEESGATSVTVKKSTLAAKSMEIDAASGRLGTDADPDADAMKLQTSVESYGAAVIGGGTINDAVVHNTAKTTLSIADNDYGSETALRLDAQGYAVYETVSDLGTGGVVAGGNSRAEVNHEAQVSADVKGKENTALKSLELSAANRESAVLKAYSAGGTVIEASEKAAEVSHVDGSNTTVNVSGFWKTSEGAAIASSSGHTLRFEAQNTKGVAVGGSSVLLQNTMKGASTLTLAGTISADGGLTAGSRTDIDINSVKEDGYAVDAAVYGAVSGAEGRSESLIDRTSKVNVAKDAQLSSGGELALSAYTDEDNTLRVRGRTAGAAAGVTAYNNNTETIKNSVDVAAGARIENADDAQKLSITASSSEKRRYEAIGDLQGAAVGGAGAKSTNSITHANTVTLAAGSSVSGAGDVLIGAGRDALGSHAEFDYTGYTHAYAHSLGGADSALHSSFDVTDSLTAAGSVTAVRNIEAAADVGDWSINETTRYWVITAASDAGNVKIASSGAGSSNPDNFNPIDSITVDGSLIAGTQTYAKVGISGVVNTDERLEIEGAASQPTITTEGVEGRIDIGSEDIANLYWERYQALQALIASYGDAGAKEARAALVAYKAEARMLLNKMIDSGYAVDDGNGNISLIASDSRGFASVSDIVVSGGDISLSTDSVKGKGTIKANAAQGIDIENTSNLALKVENVRILDKGGNLRFNSGLVGSLAGFEGVVSSQTSAPDPTIRISSDIGRSIAVKDKENGTTRSIRPDNSIVMSRVVANDAGSLEVKTSGDISIVAERVAAATDLTLEAEGSVMQSHTSGLFNVGGDVEKLYVDEVDKTNANGTYESDVLKTAGGVMVAGGDIYLNADNVNLNGLVQSGYAVWSVDLDDEAAQGRIAAIRSQWLAAGAPTTIDPTTAAYLISEEGTYQTAAGTYAKRVAAWYDPVNDRIIVDDITPTGGHIYITGRIASTGGGKLYAAAGSVDVSIDAGAASVLLGNINTGNTHGVIEITDTSYAGQTLGDKTVDALVTRWSNSGSGTDIVSSWQYSDGTTAANDASIASYKPLADQVYLWSTGTHTGTVSTIDKTQDFTVWGLFDWGDPSKWTADHVTEVADASLGSGATIGMRPDQTSGSIFVGQTDTTAETIGEWKYDTWTTYTNWTHFSGTHHLYGEKHDTATKIRTYMVKADQDVAVGFLTGTNTINVQSEADIGLSGSLTAVGGSVTLTSGGDIFSANNAAAIHGAQSVSLTAGGSIGDEMSAVRLAGSTGTVKLSAEAGGDMHLDASALAQGASVNAANLSANGTIDMIVRGAMTADVVSARDMRFESAEGSLVFNKLTQLASEDGSQRFDAVAADDVEIHAVGDLGIGKVQAKDLVSIVVDDGSLSDAIAREDLDERNAEERIQSWIDAGILGEGGTDNGKERWEADVQAQTDIVTADYNRYDAYRKLSADDQAKLEDEQKADFANLRERFGETASLEAAISAEKADADSALAKTIAAKDNYGWTKEELLYAVSEAIVNPDPGASPQAGEANIEAARVDIDVNNAGNIGNEVDQTTYSFDDLDISKSKGLEAYKMLSRADVSDVVWDADNKTVTVTLKRPISIKLSGEDARIDAQAPGNVFVASDDAIPVGVVTAQGALRLTSQKGILAAANDSILSGGTVTLRGGAGGLGSAERALQVNVTGADGWLALTAQQGVYVTETDGVMRVLSAASNAEMVLSADVGVEMAEADGALAQGVISAESLTISVGEDGSIGTSETALRLSGVESLTLTKGDIQGLYLDVAGGQDFTLAQAINASEGVGVHTQGSLVVEDNMSAGTGGIELQSQGAIKINDQTSLDSAADLSLTAGSDLAAQGAELSGTAVALKAETGAVVAGSASITASKGLEVSAQESVDLDAAQLSAEEALTLTAGADLTAQGAALSGASVALTAETGAVAADGASITAADKLDVSSKGDVGLAGAALSGANVALTAKEGFVAAGNASIAASTELDVSSKGDIGLAGAKLSTTGAAVSLSSAEGAVDLSGESVFKAQSLTLASQKDINLANRTIMVEETASVESGGSVTAQGATIQAQSLQMIAATAVNAENAKLATTEEMTLTAGTNLKAEAAQLSGASVALTAEVGAVAANGASITAADKLDVSSKGDVGLAGAALSGANVALTAKEGFVAAGNASITASTELDVSSKGDIGLAGAKLSTTGAAVNLSSAEGAVDLSGMQTLAGSRIAIEAGRDVVFNEKQTVTASDGDLAVQAGGPIVGKGIAATANGSLTLSAAGGNNLAEATLSNGGALVLRAGTVREGSSENELNLTGVVNNGAEPGTFSGTSVTLETSGSLVMGTQKATTVTATAGDAQVLADSVDFADGSSITATGGDVRVEAVTSLKAGEDLRLVGDNVSVTGGRESFQVGNNAIFTANAGRVDVIGDADLTLGGRLTVDAQKGASDDPEAGNITIGARGVLSVTDDALEIAARNGSVMVYGGQGMSIRNNLTVVSQADTVLLTEKGNLSIGNGAVVKAGTQSGLEAGTYGGIRLEAGDAFEIGESATVLADQLTVEAAGDITFGDKATLTGATDGVTIASAGGSIYMGNELTVESNAQKTLFSAQKGDIVIGREATLTSSNSQIEFAAGRDVVFDEDFDVHGLGFVVNAGNNVTVGDNQTVETFFSAGDYHTSVTAGNGIVFGDKAQFHTTELVLTAERGGVTFGDDSVTRTSVQGIRVTANDDVTYGSRAVFGTFENAEEGNISIESLSGNVLLGNDAKIFSGASTSISAAEGVTLGEESIILSTPKSSDSLVSINAGKGDIEIGALALIEGYEASLKAQEGSVHLGDEAFVITSNAFQIEADRDIRVDGDFTVYDVTLGMTVANLVHFETASGDIVFADNASMQTQGSVEISSGRDIQFGDNVFIDTKAEDSAYPGSDLHHEVNLQASGSVAFGEHAQLQTKGTIAVAGVEGVSFAADAQLGSSAGSVCIESAEGSIAFTGGANAYAEESLVISAGESVTLTGESWLDAFEELSVTAERGDILMTDSVRLGGVDDSSNVATKEMTLAAAGSIRQQNIAADMGLTAEHLTVTAGEDVLLGAVDSGAGETGNSIASADIQTGGALALGLAYISTDLRINEADGGRVNGSVSINATDSGVTIGNDLAVSGDVQIYGSSIAAQGIAAGGKLVMSTAPYDDAAGGGIAAQALSAESIGLMTKEGSISVTDLHAETTASVLRTGSSVGSIDLGHGRSEKTAMIFNASGAVLGSISAAESLYVFTGRNADTTSLILSADSGRAALIGNAQSLAKYLKAPDAAGMHADDIDINAFPVIDFSAMIEGLDREPSLTLRRTKQDVESQTRFAVPEAGNPEEAVTDRWSKELETKGWYTAKHPARLSVSFRD